MTDPRRQAELAREADEDLRWVLSSPAGRRFYLRLIDEVCRLDSLSFNESQRVTDHREGERAVGAWLRVEAQRVSFDEWKRAVLEAFERVEAERAAAVKPAK